MPSRHNTPYHRHDNRAVGNTKQKHREVGSLIMPACIPTNWTGTFVRLLRFSRRINRSCPLLYLCVCPQTGQVHSYSLIRFFCLSCFVWPPVSAIDWLALCFLGFFLVCFLSPGGVLGPVSCGLFASACSGCPFVSGVIWSVCFLCGFALWCRGFLLAFCCCCCLFLGCFARLCFWCVGLLRLGSLSPCLVPCSARPLG